LADTAGHPLHVHNRQHPSTHAPPAARSSPANPFLESPADSSTRAPNLQRLRQSGDARQDLVRNSESTTKCGDCGEESGGDAEVSKIRGESERPLRALSRFAVEQRRIVPQECLCRAAGGVWIGCFAGRAQLRAVTLSPRNHGLFPAILSEISRNSRYFRAD
jgi:hypothetical protein